MGWTAQSYLAAAGNDYSQGKTEKSIRGVTLRDLEKERSDK